MGDRFPIVRELLSTVAILPTSTASCERGFGVMNMVNRKLGSSLKAIHVNYLIIINRLGPSLEDFDARRCSEHCYYHTKGFRHIKSTCNQYILSSCQHKNENEPQYLVRVSVAKFII
jgi:hypothetical protein